ncbi:hypothetical protein J8273_1737 [Carpediemonas membranifera]|uniref:Uncharacterized protein n=1 Tax=Carpediemonas membranifera TaxID=201153 RepID=A0A8J6BAK5_9EUKA|nr:hypothetical protein J8273_1737 [Carpediemonas membranifera]|eukprot:KAG9396719.1 hypothetical protein J8273_1737 [Carpediemonas membranifera]
MNDHGTNHDSYGTAIGEYIVSYGVSDISEPELYGASSGPVLSSHSITASMDGDLPQLEPHTSHQMMEDLVPSPKPVETVDNTSQTSSDWAAPHAYMARAMNQPPADFDSYDQEPLEKPSRGTSVESGGLPSSKEVVFSQDTIDTIGEELAVRVINVGQQRATERNAFLQLLPVFLIGCFITDPVFLGLWLMLDAVIPILFLPFFALFIASSRLFIIDLIHYRSGRAKRVRLVPIGALAISLIGLPVIGVQIGYNLMFRHSFV